MPKPLKDILTTGQVAKLMGIGHITVTRLFDNGTLPGWRIPGSAHRRFSKEAIFAFMKDNNIPDCREGSSVEETKARE